MSENKFDLMFYDKSPWAGKALTFSFINGGKFYKMFRSVENHAGFDNWADALTWLTTVEPDKKIDTIQFWGHGFTGGIAINGESLKSSSLKPQSKYYTLLKALKARLKPDSVIWLRSCASFAGILGKKFAQDLANFFGCTVAGHSFIIGPWQSGLHTLRPGEQPSWSDIEGFTKDKEGVLVSAWSKPWETHTIFCLTGKIPKNW